MTRGDDMEQTGDVLPGCFQTVLWIWGIKPFI